MKRAMTLFVCAILMALALASPVAAAGCPSCSRGGGNNVLSAQP